jgi:hypothetical protein
LEERKAMFNEGRGDEEYSFSVQKSQQ